MIPTTLQMPDDTALDFLSSLGQRLLNKEGTDVMETVDQPVSPFLFSRHNIIDTGRCCRFLKTTTRLVGGIQLDNKLFYTQISRFLFSEYFPTTVFNIRALAQ